MMPTRETIVQGASKILYEYSQPGTGLLHFQDPPLGDSGERKGRGMINAGLSALLMQRMESIGLSTHFIKVHNSREHLVKLVETLPIFVSVHNVVSDSFGQRLGIAEGTPLSRNIVECHLKDHELNHPLVTQEHAMSFGWCSVSEWDEMTSTATRINDFLVGQFSALHLELFSFQVEFGRYYGSSVEDYQLVICDEMSLEMCHLRDLRTGRIHRPSDHTMDSEGDAFYQDVARRFGILSEIYRPVAAQPPVRATPVFTIVE